MTLALLAMALAVTIGVREFRRWHHHAQVAALGAELRELGEAFTTYRVQRGEWPPATNPENRLPRGMESALARTSWLTGPAVGGSYDWQPPPSLKSSAEDNANLPGRILLTGFSAGTALNLSEDDLRALDRLIDDGDLTTGLFRRGFNGWPVRLVPPRR